MGAVYFYHLTRKPLETTLPLLLSKALGAGWHCLVIGSNPARLGALDQALWKGKDTEFFAHGLAGAPHEAEQPILLSNGNSVANNAACVMCVDGAEITAEQVQKYERACVLFDGNDERAVQVARGQWKTLTEAGCAAQYWSEESGNWQMKAKKDQRLINVIAC